MDVDENTMPLRFSPDGLDEAAVDALIAETGAGLPEVVESHPAQLILCRSTVEPPSLSGHRAA